MDSLELFKILILSNQIPRINKILSTLRNEGAGLNTQVATDRFELQDKIKSQNWDILICSEDSPVSINVVREIIKNQDLELPTIFLTEKNLLPEVEKLANIGVNDSLPIQEKTRIISAIKREVCYQRMKKHYRELKLDYKELEKRHQAVMDISSAPLAYIQEDMHLYCNESYAHLFSNFSLNKVRNTLFLNLFTGQNRKRLKKCLSKKFNSELTLSLELASQQKDGLFNSSELAFSFTPASFKGHACLLLIIKPGAGNPDYSEQVNTVHNQDLLTQLYNKKYFYEKIELAVSKAIKQQQHSSLLIIQLNQFLDLKSTIGLSKANQVLNDVTIFLRKSIQKKFSAARIDDYEFGLLIENYKLAESIELANFIKSKINNYITSTALPNMQLSSSIGIALINESAFDAKDLIAKARSSLDKTFSDKTHPLSQNLQQPVINNFTSYINLALKEKRLKLLYQPIIDLNNTHHQKYEVLSRILDNHGNDMLPSDFLPVINLSGLGEEFDKAVISLALDHLNNLANGNIHLVINLTSNTLLSKTFLTWLSGTLQQNINYAERLFFQINETHICNNLEYCSKFSIGLKELGLACIVSDYGCAAQAENYLDDIRPVYVKLDKNLVRDIGFSDYQYNELKNLFKNLHNKQFKIAVSQVEDAAMLPILYKLDIDFIQGYYLARPLQVMNYKFIQHHDITACTLAHNQKL